MSYHVRKSIDIDFAHHVHGHSGACINIHGHTWKFEVTLSAEELDPEGFVVDFKKLKTTVLEPIHTMLDHGFAMFDRTLFQLVDGRTPFIESLTALGALMVQTREQVSGTCEGKNRWLFHTELLKTMGVWTPQVRDTLDGAFDFDVGGIKTISFPFPPTSERLARWLFNVAKARMEDSRVIVASARVYETLHPVESMAEYTP